MTAPLAVPAEKKVAEAPGDKGSARRIFQNLEFSIAVIMCEQHNVRPGAGEDARPLLLPQGGGVLIFQPVVRVDNDDGRACV